MLFLHVWWRIMRFSQPLDGTLCIFVRNSNGVYEICFFSKLINRRQVDGLSSHPCFEELEWHRGRQLQCFRNIENSRQCPESTKKTQLYEILPANCRLQKKKSLTSNITVVLVTCVVVIGVILSIMSSSFSVEWIVFLTFMSGTIQIKAESRVNVTPPNIFLYLSFLFLSIYDHAQTWNDQPPFC